MAHMDEQQHHDEGEMGDEDVSQRGTQTTVDSSEWRSRKTAVGMQFCFLKHFLKQNFRDEVNFEEYQTVSHL